jgi:periplasmic protein TonB
MTTAVANPPPFGLRRFLVYSGILHALLILWIALAAVGLFKGPEWTGAGGGGDSVKVSLVSSAGLPMPQPPAVTESKTVDTSKSLYKEEEVKPPPEPPKPEEKIQQFKHEKPLPPSKKSRIMEDKTPIPDNAVRGPQGGAPKIPSGYQTVPGGGQGPISAQDQGGGDFASRYSWYIEAVKRRIQGNWLQNTIDPGVRAARTAHAVVQFTIERDGSVKDIHITQGSGNYSMDNSGLRAVIASNPMPALPNDYSGSYVTVVFDFDLSLTQ